MSRISQAVKKGTLPILLQPLLVNFLPITVPRFPFLANTNAALTVQTVPSLGMLREKLNRGNLSFPATRTFL